MVKKFGVTRMGWVVDALFDDLTDWNDWFLRTVSILYLCECSPSLSGSMAYDLWDMCMGLFKVWLRKVILVVQSVHLATVITHIPIHVIGYAGIAVKNDCIRKMIFPSVTAGCSCSGEASLSMLSTARTGALVMGASETAQVLAVAVQAGVIL